jgi:hypothetical protein
MYYDHNMQVLQQCRNYFYELIEKKDWKEDSTIRIESVPTRVQEKALIVDRDGIPYRLNSKYNPEEEAVKWAEQYKAKNLDTVFTIFGLGNGCFVRALAKRLEKDNRLIVYEPSSLIFRHVLQEYNLEDILQDERIILIVQDINEHELAYVVSATMTWMNLFSHKRCFHPGYDRLFEQSYSDFTDMLDNNTFNSVVAKNTYSKMGKAVVENTLINLKHFKKSISIWDLEKNLPRDIPVIIAAAGPSLNKNIEELRNAKGRSIIIAVDRAYEIFLNHGIEPDFVIVLDAMKELKYCGNVPGFTVPLLYKYEASPEILSNHNGRKIIYSFDGFAGSFYQTIDRTYPGITSGGSVTTAAFAVCATLGFERIILIGCDLAYDGNKTHAGQVQDEITENYRRVNLYVEDIYGNKVRSRHDWYTFIWWFEGVIVQLKNVDVIDATEGGAKIKGTRIMTLKEVVDNYCTNTIDCAGILEQTKSDITEDEYHRLNDYLKKAEYDLEQIEGLAIKALEYCEQLKHNLGQGKTLASQQITIQEVTVINQTIEAMPVYSLINTYILGRGTNSIGELFFMTTNQKTDDMVAVRNMTKIYNIIKEACDFLMPIFKESLSDFIGE